MIEINNAAKQKINSALIKKTAQNFLKAYGKEKYDLSIAFVSGAAMRKLNKQYRNINQTTDVLSFAGEGDFLGEIIIDCAQVKGQAAEFGNSLENELIFILVHGLLHLIGYDDATEKGMKEMIKLGEEFLNKQ